MLWLLAVDRRVLTPSVLADVTLPAIFSDHMVLQCDALVPVWGWAEPGEKITVEICGQTKTAVADGNGKWMLKLDKMKTGEIASLIPFAIRGAIWYQGESNAFQKDGGRLYAKQLPLMISDWRTRWGYDFPFAWVQLPNFRSDRFLGWCEVRESMLKALSVPDTGMAIALELGEPDNIHPKNKQEVGRRLALWALAKVYGQMIGNSRKP